MLKVPDAPTLTLTFRMVTPEMAAAWLDLSGRTRPLNAAKVRELAEVMEAGGLVLNGEAIVFGADGRLLDGAKRLAACGLSGVAFPSLVVEGVDPAAEISLDARKMRQTSDILNIDGSARGRAMSATLALVARMADGAWAPHARNLGPAATVEMRRMHPGIDAVLEKAYSKGRHGSPIAHAAVHFLLDRVDPAMADDFFACMRDPDGCGLGARDARRMAARRLRMAAEKRERMTLRQQAGILVMAWNSWQAGTRSPVMELSEDAPFPEIEFWEARHRVEVPGARHVAARASVPGGPDALFGGVGASVVAVTPALAAEWLSRNEGNRVVSEKTVDRYARDMSDGAWLLNGETVKRSVSGRMLDAQHRMMAVVRSGETVSMIVVTGLPDDVFSTFDIGERRQFKNYLHEKGKPTAAGAAAKVVLCVERDTAMSGLLPTNAELDDVLRRHPDLYAVSARVDGIRVKPMEPSLAAATLYLFGRSNPEKAEEFLAKIRQDVAFSEKDPVRALSDRLWDRRPGAGMSKGDTPTTRVGLCITAWNASLRGRKMSRISVDAPEGRVYPDIG